MISGIYSAAFVSNQNVPGRGVAIFSNGTIHGGDAAFYYRGKFKLDEKNISATIEVVKYAADAISVVGDLNRFKLGLNGIIQPHGFTLSGQVEGHPTKRIAIELKRIDDLVDDLEVV